MNWESPMWGSGPWRGSIKNSESHKASRWDWRWLESVLPRKISPSDIDHVLFTGVALDNAGERILFLETKSPGVELSIGQERFFKSLSVRDGQFVLVLWGELDDPIKAQWIIDGEVHPEIEASQEWVTSVVDRFFNP